jgi:adenylate cyclase
MRVLAADKILSAKPERDRRWIFLSGLILSILITLLYIFRPSFLSFLDNKLYDTFLKSNATNETSKIPMVVDIDDKSIAQFGQWPWPRYRIALLLEKLRGLGALTVALDMVFHEADRTSLEILQKEIQRDLNIRVDLSKLPKTLMDNDLILAQTLSRGPFVLGYSFTFSDKSQMAEERRLHPLNVVVMKTPDANERSEFLYRPQDAVCNLKILSEAVSSEGFFNAIKDSDGILRRVPLIIEYNNALYPSLALATYIHAYRITRVVLRATSIGAETIALDKTIVPVDANGNLWIHYRGKARTFDYVSAGDILLNLVPKEQIQGRIVFIGSTAAGIGESHAIPLDPLFPGTEIHATVIDNLLKKDFISRPDWIHGMGLMVTFVLGIISTLILIWTGAVSSLFIFGCLALGVWLTSEWIFQTKGLFISPLFPLLTLTGQFTFLTLLKYRQKERTVKLRTEQLATTQEFVIQCLAALAEARDSEASSHIFRCQRYVKALSNQMANSQKFSRILNLETIDLLCKCAPLHDIGKVGVPDRILLKPDKLTDVEFEEMKRHTTYGRDAIQKAERRFRGGVSSRFLQFGKEMAYSHHERWDGSGYPEGLARERIPISGRIMALVDVYDALISKRAYKPAFSHEEAVSFIIKHQGIHFDPDVVEAFLKVLEEFRKTALQFPDQGN